MVLEDDGSLSLLERQMLHFPVTLTLQKAGLHSIQLNAHGEREALDAVEVSVEPGPPVAAVALDPKALENKVVSDSELFSTMVTVKNQYWLEVACDVLQVRFLAASDEAAASVGASRELMGKAVEEADGTGARWKLTLCEEVLRHARGKYVSELVARPRGGANEKLETICVCPNVSFEATRSRDPRHFTAREVCMLLRERGISTAADVLKDFDDTAEVAGDAFVKKQKLLPFWLGWTGLQASENSELIEKIAREIESLVKEADLMRGAYKCMVRNSSPLSCAVNAMFHFQTRHTIEYDLALAGG